MTPAVQAVVTALEARGAQRQGENWTCPAHEDRKPSLSVSEGGDGRALVHCHAGCQLGDILAALQLTESDLFPAPRARTRAKASTKPIEYLYTDESGQPLFRVVRSVDRDGAKKFWQEAAQPDGSWRKGAGAMRGVRRALFGLPELLKADPSAPVFLVEGEKDALNVSVLGLVATTNPGGAGKWRSCTKHGKGSFVAPLRDRLVVILPDNDEVGRAHATEVAAALQGVAASVRILELPGLPEKGDVSDWLADGGTSEALLGLCAGACEPERPVTAGGGGNEATRLVEAALRAGARLFHDQRDEPFAVIPSGDGNRILSVNGRDFGFWLRKIAWEDGGSAPAGETITTARHTLGSMARFDGPQHALHVRCAWHDDAIWIQLDAYRAVQVRADGWEIVERPPILFRTFSHQRSLPLPERGGELDEVLTFVRIQDAASKRLFLCYLVAALVPDIPIACLIVHGMHGAAKTTLLKIVKQLLDPAAVAVRGGVRDQTEFAQAVSQSRATFFDNLTSLPAWLSDAMCRATTGEGWSKRTLYTDEDTTFVEYRGVLGLSGINLVVDRPDLLDRSIILPLERVPEGERRAEREFWAGFESERPRLFGAMLTALARAMELEPQLHLEALPRMADFARWGAAASEALGSTSQSFLGAYAENVKRQNDAAIDASPLAQAVIEFMRDRDGWTGTPSLFLEELRRAAASVEIDMKDRAWPLNVNWLWRRLRPVLPNLMDLGIECVDERSRDGRRITLRSLKQPTAEPDSGTVLLSHADIGVVTGKPLGDSVRVDIDDSDGISAAIRGGEADATDAWDEERMAIQEFDGGLTRAEAERRAIENAAPLPSSLEPLGDAENR